MCDTLSKGVNNNSGDEVLVEIESSNKIVVDERLGWPRANFPRDLNGVRTPLVYYEDKVSSSNYVRDVGPLFIMSSLCLLYTSRCV